MFTWDLASGAPVSALGCGGLRTYDVARVLGSVYVRRAPRRAPGEGGAAGGSPGRHGREGGDGEGGEGWEGAMRQRRPSWRT